MLTTPTDMRGTVGRISQEPARQTRASKLFFSYHVNSRIYLFRLIPVIYFYFSRANYFFDPVYALSLYNPKL